MLNAKHLLVVGAVGLSLMATAALPASADPSWGGERDIHRHHDRDRDEHRDRSWNGGAYNYGQYNTGSYNNNNGYYNNGYNGYYNNAYYNNGYNGSYNNAYTYPYSAPAYPYGYYPGGSVMGGYYNNGTGFSVTIPVR